MRVDVVRAAQQLMLVATHRSARALREPQNTRVLARLHPSPLTTPDLQLNNDVQLRRTASSTGALKRYIHTVAPSRILTLSNDSGCRLFNILWSSSTQPVGTGFESFAYMFSLRFHLIELSRTNITSVANISTKFTASRSNFRSYRSHRLLVSIQQILRTQYEERNLSNAVYCPRACQND